MGKEVAAWSLSELHTSDSVRASKVHEAASRTVVKNRVSGVETTYGHVNGPDTVSELLKNADAREAEKEDKKRRQEVKKQETEQKIVANARNLKVVEESWRGGNKTLGKPLTKSVEDCSAPPCVSDLCS